MSDHFILRRIIFVLWRLRTQILCLGVVRSSPANPSCKLKPPAQVLSEKALWAIRKKPLGY